MLLIDQFTGKMQTTVSGLLNRRDDPLARSGMGAIIQAARLCDKILFADSTMQMLSDKLAHYDDTVQEVLRRIGEQNRQQIVENILSYRGGWIEFSKPFLFSDRKDGSIAAMLFFVPSVYVTTGRDKQHLYLISETADIVDALESTPFGQWEFLTGYHVCRACTIEYGVRVPCELCRYKLMVWNNIFALSAIIAGQYLAAMRYEERTCTTMARIPREKSTGKERRKPVKHVFKVIDANEIIITSLLPDDTHRKEERGSWIDSSVVYEEITTRPFTRTYRHPRYVNMRGQTTDFPQGIKRLQPRKPEMIGKTVTKVKASLYEKNPTS